MSENNYTDLSSSREKDIRKELKKLFNTCPIEDSEMLNNLGLFVKRQLLSRILFMHELYKKIINIHGVVMEFGVRWGQNMALFENFRGIYEPFNYNRKIIGFDTFDGFPEVSEKDGDLKAGDYGVTQGYMKYLQDLLDYHELESPISHIKKYELIKGDACESFEKYLTDHPETIVSLAYFDFDLYEPTKKCLKLIKGHLTKGSIIGFDELNVKEFPGETLALKEIFNLSECKIMRSPLSPLQSYIEFS